MPRVNRSSKGSKPIHSLSKTCDPEVLKEMEDCWLKGMEALEIARQFSQPLKAVQRWINKDLINKYSSRYERLTLTFNSLFEATEVAHQRYMDDPSNANSMAYTGIVNSLRGAMVDLDNVQDNAALADDLLSIVLNPLIRRLTNVLIDELGNFKEELMLKFDEDDADRIVNDVTTRVGSHFKTATQQTVERLESVLSVKDNNKRKALGGAKKRGHLKSVPSL